MENQIWKEYIPNNNLEQFEENLFELLENYDTELQLLYEYTIEYYQLYGEIPEEFPPDLQLMWDTIINELLTFIEGWDINNLALAEECIAKEYLVMGQDNLILGGDVPIPLGGITGIEI